MVSVVREREVGLDRGVSFALQKNKRNDLIREGERGNIVEAIVSKAVVVGSGGFACGGSDVAELSCVYQHSVRGCKLTESTYLTDRSICDCLWRGGGWYCRCCSTRRGVRRIRLRGRRITSGRFILRLSAFCQKVQTHEKYALSRAKSACRCLTTDP
jgi:hypothetical protein